jgi:hypothetical protein
MESEHRYVPDSQKEQKELKDINKEIRTAATYLQRLDKYAEGVDVDADSGNIDFKKQDLELVVDPAVKQYQNNFTKVNASFGEDAQKCAESMKKTKGVLDAKVVMGAVVVTYNSAREIPEKLKFEPETSRAEHVGPADEPTGRYLGLVTIDISKQRRQDQVTPTVSAVHELRHHALKMSDYLLSQSPNLQMDSAFRSGRPGALYGRGPDRITTRQAFYNDREIYSKLLGREFLPSDITRVQAQLDYLDELHSSYLQEKPNWFDARKNVYAKRQKGKHWELVGDHSADIAASKELYAYVQGFHIINLLHRQWKGKVETNPYAEKDKLEFVKAMPDIFGRTGALIGAARTVHQAKDLLKEEWIEIKKNYPSVLESQGFKSMLDGGEKNRFAVEKLREVLLK